MVDCEGILEPDYEVESGITTIEGYHAPDGSGHQANMSATSLQSFEGKAFDS